MNLPKERLATICAECEQLIGTQGGGMDQAIAFLASKSKFNVELLMRYSEDELLTTNVIKIGKQESHAFTEV